MKKQRLKNYLKFGILLFGISLFIISCQKDDDFKTIENNTLANNSSYKTKRIYAKEIEQNKTIKNKINKIKEKQNTLKANTQNKTVYFLDYDFTINTDFAVYLENQDASYHSYTFKVFRDSTEFSLENLILSSNSNNDYDIYLSQYNLSEDDIALIQNNQSPDLRGKAILTKIIDEDFIDNIFSKETITITTLCPVTSFVAGNDCGCDGHHTLAQILAGTYCQCFAQGGVTLTADQTVFSWEECGIQISEGGGGGSTGTSGGGSGTPTGSDPDPYDPTDPNIHGNGGNPIISAPALEDIQDTNPKKLKILTQHPQIKAKITELKTKTSENREYGYQFNITGNNPITYNPIEGELASDNQGIKFPPPSVFTQLEIHTHFDGLDNAFTASDIYKATKLAITNPNAPAILVAPNGKLYALMVTDQAKAQVFLNYNNQEGEEKMNGYYNKGVIKVANYECGGTCTDQEYDTYLNQALVQYLSSMQWDAGLTLYEATEDGNGNITWTPVTITP